jgi:hypothetical protein
MQEDINGRIQTLISHQREIQQKRRKPHSSFRSEQSRTITKEESHDAREVAPNEEFLIPELFWCQSIAGAKALLTPAIADDFQPVPSREFSAILKRQYGQCGIFTTGCVSLQSQPI